MNRPSPRYEYMSLDDFEELLPDKPADEKWELIGGRVVRMMVGARWEHHLIVQNLAFGLRRRLEGKGSSCNVFTETFYMKEKSINSATLPDVMVRCGPLEPGAVSVNDPIILVEVLSEDSKARDRIKKWAIYQKLPSLRHYVLVERDRPLMEVFDRTGENWSGPRVLEGLEANLDLPALGVGLPLREIYLNVIAGANRDGSS